MAYYISPRFLDKLAIHITKNFLDLPGVRVPLILGIHGRKGEGKSFQCELIYQKMGIEVVHMTADECCQRRWNSLVSVDIKKPVKQLRPVDIEGPVNLLLNGDSVDLRSSADNMDFYR